MPEEEVKSVESEGGVGSVGADTEDYKAPKAPAPPPSGLQINQEPKPIPTAKPVDTDGRPDVPKCKYSAEAHQIDDIITKLIFDGRTDVKYQPHRAEAIRTLKMALSDITFVI